MIVVRPLHPPLAVHDAMGLATDAELAAVAAVGSAAIPLAQRGAANGVATLGADAKIPGSQLPALAIGETFTVVSQAAMLALVAQRGDIAVRTDLTPSGFFLLTTDSPGTLADWLQVTAPGSVVSVNARSGVVTGLAEQSDLTAEATTRAAADTTLTTNVATKADAAATTAALAAKAADNAVVHLTGAETVAGIKTFSAAPVLPAASVPKASLGALTIVDADISAISEAKITNLVADLAGKAATTDARLTDQRTPSDASVTDAKVAAGAAIAEVKLALASDAAANVASRRTLGPGSTQAVPGNRLAVTLTVASAAPVAPVNGDIWIVA